MQYLPETYLGIALAGALVCLAFFAFIRLHWKKLRGACTAIDDQWILSTKDGRFFEEVDVVGIEHGEVIFKHRVGEERIAVDLLTPDSQVRLDRGFENAPAWNAKPTDGKRPDVLPDLSSLHGPVSTRWFGQKRS